MGGWSLRVEQTVDGVSDTALWLLALWGKAQKRNNGLWEKPFSLMPLQFFPR